MPNKVNVLVFVHGMTPDVVPSDPRSHGGTYDKFWQALQAEKPALTNLFPNGPILVEWGHQLSPTENPVREDHRITEVERFVNEQVAYHNIKDHPGPNNVLTNDWGIPVVRQLVTGIREGVISFGLTDVIYYCSADGEIYVRAQVYNRVLAAMQPYVTEPNVRIHLFGHSLGVTIVHDFLFGLFKKGHMSDFVEKYQGGAWVEVLLRHRRLAGVRKPQSLQSQQCNHGHSGRFWRSAADRPCRLLGKQCRDTRNCEVILRLCNMRA